MAGDAPGDGRKTVRGLARLSYGGWRWPVWPKAGHHCLKNAPGAARRACVHSHIGGGFSGRGGMILAAGGGKIVLVPAILAGG